MGRYSTGAITTDQAMRIELSDFVKKGFLKDKKNQSMSMNWSNGNSIGVESSFEGNMAYIRLLYTDRDRNTNVTNTIDYKVYLTSIPSNLGKGEVYYFICPQTGLRCRVLYKCYKSNIFKSRLAYKNRIYYQTQIDSKSIRAYRYLFCDNKLNDLYDKMTKSHYKGKPTRIIKRIDELNRKIDLAMVNYSGFERLMCK